jgi:hypothetical protein
MLPAFTMKDIKQVLVIFLFHTVMNCELGRHVFMQVSQYECCEISEVLTALLLKIQVSFGT